MSKEKVMCGYTTTKELQFGDVIEVRFKESELELLKKYLTGGTEQYEASVTLQLMNGKSGNLYSSINTYFYDKANGGTSGSGSRNNAAPIATPEPPEDLPF